MNQIKVRKQANSFVLRQNISKGDKKAQSSALPTRNMGGGSARGYNIHGGWTLQRSVNPPSPITITPNNNKLQ